MSLHIPNDPFTQRLQQISQWIAQGQLQQAAQALTQAQAQEPQDARIALLGMRLADQAGNPAGALKAAQRAVALAPGWHVALTGKERPKRRCRWRARPLPPRRKT